MADQLHHYVPRFILRRFSQDDQPLHVMDKQTGKRFRVSASKKSTIEVAAERGMYDFEFMGVSMTLEPGLAALESKAAEVIERITLEETLNHTDLKERAALASFLAVQMVRTRAVTVTHQEFFGRFKAWLRRKGASERFFKADPFVGGGENAEKALQAKMIVNATSDLGPTLAGKDWVLLKTDLKAPYVMGDHPLTMFNQTDHRPYGNLGVKVKGIELYFPLSPTLALGMWCPSIQQGLLYKFKHLNQLPDSAAAQYMEAWEDGIRIVEAVRSGTALINRPESVTHFNSLQIVWAERFLFSRDGDFTLAEQLIRDNPVFRYGKRIEEATGKF